MIRKLLMLTSTIYVCLLSAQLKIHSISDVERLKKEEDKPLLIYIGTNWCPYCKAMETKTFSENKIIDYVNKYYYFIKIDAEEKSTLSFQGKDYSFVPTGISTGYHEIIQKLLPQQNYYSYPWIIIYDQEKTIWQKSGFVGAKELLPIILQIQ